MTASTSSIPHAQVSRTYRGRALAKGMRVAVVAARFNQLVVDPLLAGARDAFADAGGDPAHLAVAYVPGAFEVPLVAKTLAASGNFDAVVCLGAIVRGSTPHFDYVAAQAAAGVMQAGLATGVPVVFGVLTCDTVEQAMDRAGLKAGNKGSDAMRAAIETAQLLQQLAAEKAAKNNAATR